MSLVRFNRLTARIAVIGIIIAVLAGIAALPLSGKRQTVWPLTRHFAMHHTMAMVEMMVVWVTVGVVILLLFIVLMHDLLKRAGWTK